MEGKPLTHAASATQLASGRDAACGAGGGGRVGLLFGLFGGVWWWGCGFSRRYFVLSVSLFMYLFLFLSVFFYCSSSLTFVSLSISPFPFLSDFQSLSIFPFLSDF